MLWNWYTIDSCFIARSWHVRSAGAFAGSCIGVILLVLALEALRRGQRELDRYFRRVNAVTSPGSSATEVGSSSGSSPRKGLRSPAGAVVGPLKVWQQLVRSAVFMAQFAVGYFVMLKQKTLKEGWRSWRLLVMDMSLPLSCYLKYGSASKFRAEAIPVL